MKYSIYSDRGDNNHMQKCYTSSHSGFKREDIRVQLDNAGKLFVKGSRLAADNKYIDVDQSFDVPKVVVADKISGMFEDGRLSLIMPKSSAVAKGETVMNEATKEEKSKQEATKEEQPKQEDEKHEQGKYGKEKKDDITREEKTRSNEENQMEKPTITEAIASVVKDAKSRITKATHKEPTQEKEREFADTDTTGHELHDNNKHEDVENLKAKTAEGIMHQKEKKAEEAIEEMKENYKEKFQAISREVKREKGKMKGTMQKMKLKMNEIHRDKPKGIKKKISKMGQGEDGWLNSKYADGALEKIKRNRNIIAVAVLAFSFGLYVSHKLKAKK